MLSVDSSSTFNKIIYKSVAAVTLQGKFTGLHEILDMPFAKKAYVLTSCCRFVMGGYGYQMYQMYCLMSKV